MNPHSPEHITLQIYLPRDSFDVQVDITIPGRGVTAIFGPSGCGKTSLLRALAGLEDAAIDSQRTRIHVKGETWYSTGKQVPTHQRKVGYVFQEASLFDHLSVQKNLEFGRKRNQPAQVPMDEIIALLDLAPLLNRSTVNLSGGERQRVAIARALLASPTLLLMDEPLAALDQKRKQEILPYLERLQGYLSIPMIYVSHALDEIVQLANHLLLMENGRIVAQGAVTDLLSDNPLLAQRDDAFTLLSGHVMESNTEHQLTRVRVGESEFFLPRVNRMEGQAVQLRLYARDISLCLDYPQRTSILNILPARILALDNLVDKGQTLVHLAIAGQPVLARISYLSCTQLGLVIGQQVYAQIKALAIMK
jgi:molybdate transport system ATP-binding protein